MTFIPMIRQLGHGMRNFLQDVSSVCYLIQNLLSSNNVPPEVLLAVRESVKFLIERANVTEETINSQLQELSSNDVAPEILLAVRESVKFLIERVNVTKETINSQLEALSPMKTPRLNVLVVEDHEKTRDFLKVALANAGHLIIGEASNGHDMVSYALNNEKIDLIVFDVHLPGQDGFDALKEITTYKLVPAVAITGDSGWSLMERGLEEYVLGYLIKPVEPVELNAAVAVAFLRFNEINKLKEENESLEALLERRKLVERAKGIIMRRWRWGEADAFRWLQKTAMDLRLPIADVARDVIGGRRFPLV